MKEDYLKIPLDKNKRHFVFGDIHGKYHALMRLLDEFNYDPAGDMLYSVGDLVDRGPQCVEVVKMFTEESNTHAIMGNHEYMMIDRNWFQTWVHCGGIQTDDSLRTHGLDRTWLTKKIMKLPMVMDVGEDNDADSFRLIHAEMPWNWDENNLMINLLSKDKEYLSDKLQWGRKTLASLRHNPDPKYAFDLAKKKKLQNPRNVFCGHTGVGWITRIGNQWYCDTGPNALSCINALTKEE